MTFQYYPPQLLQKARETYWGELAWHVCDIPDVLECSSTLKIWSFWVVT